MRNVPKLELGRVGEMIWVLVRSSNSRPQRCGDRTARAKSRVLNAMFERRRGRSQSSSATHGPARFSASAVAGRRRSRGKASPKYGLEGSGVSADGVGADADGVGADGVGVDGVGAWTALAWSGVDGVGAERRGRRWRGAAWTALARSGVDGVRASAVTRGQPNWRIRRRRKRQRARRPSMRVGRTLTSTPRRRILTSKKVVGAGGFEPPTP